MTFRPHTITSSSFSSSSPSSSFIAMSILWPSLIFTLLFFLVFLPLPLIHQFNHIFSSSVWFLSLPTSSFCHLILSQCSYVLSQHSPFISSFVYIGSTSHSCSSSSPSMSLRLFSWVYISPSLCFSFLFRRYLTLCLLRFILLTISNVLCHFTYQNIYFPVFRLSLFLNSINS